MPAIRHLKVQNFRGIKSLDWHLDGRVLCLLGPGDSCKSTVLTAIELALLPRWSFPFTDSDFYQANTSESIIIEATVGDLPEKLAREEEKYGLCLRGYAAKTSSIHDDPNDDHEVVLTIRLTVDSDLEPQWTVFKESNRDPRSITWRDRELLRVAVLGSDVDQTLTWSRGSSLSRLTDSKSSGEVIAVANRHARDAVADMQLDEWQVIADETARIAKSFGVSLSDLKPGLDIRAIRFGQGILALHDGKIPVQLNGLGSRRLTALAVQRSGAGSSSIILIDEIEHGLEPHRIRKLLSVLCDETSGGQVIMTSHSPTTVVARSVEELRFLQCKEGLLSIDSCTIESRSALQSVVRKCPLAVFARRIIVCEGKTEEALCRVLNKVWTHDHENEGFETLGVLPAVGEGSAAPEVARQFASLGYSTILFADSDKSLHPNKNDVEAAGAKVLIWQGTMATEQRIATDVPKDTLQKIVAAAEKSKGPESCVAQLNNELQKLDLDDCTIPSLNISEWEELGIDDDSVRKVIGNTAKNYDWFKNLNDGEILAEIVVPVLQRIENTPLAEDLRTLEKWVYAK